MIPEAATDPDIAALLADPDIATLLAAMRRGITPPPDLWCDEWADLYRVLDSRTSSETGQWLTSRTPYSREIMRRLSPQDPCEHVVWMKGSQVGATEVGNNWVGYTIDYDPSSMLVVQSTVDLVKDWSQGRFDPMVELIPRVLEKLGSKRARDSMNKIRAKFFPNGALYAAGANSPAGLRSKPIKKIFLDERDSFPSSAGKEGDPGELAIRRSAAFPGRKIFEVSTPTTTGSSPIESAFMMGDQRYFEVPCPHCGCLLVLSHEHLVWEEGNARDSTRYVCEHCHRDILDSHKEGLLAQGSWSPRAAFDGIMHSYHLSAFYSPWFRFWEIARTWEKAKIKKDPMLLQTVWNTLFGLSWEDPTTAKLDPVGLLAARIDWFRGPDGALAVPFGAAVLTAGVDTQDNRLEVSVYAWGANREAWRIGHYVIHGSPNDPQTWARLDALLDREWAHESGIRSLRVQAVCIDTGGHFTDQVYAYTRPRRGLRRFPIRGASGEGTPIWPLRASVVKRSQNELLWHVGVDSAKAWVSHRLAASLIHYGPECDSTWFAQLTAEKRRVRYDKGHPVAEWWKPDHERNEALDCVVYALAALHAWESEGNEMERELEVVCGRRLSRQEEVERAETREPAYDLNRKQGWLRRGRS